MKISMGSLGLIRKLLVISLQFYQAQRLQDASYAFIWSQLPGIRLSITGHQLAPTLGLFYDTKTNETVCCCFCRSKAEITLSVSFAFCLHQNTSLRRHGNFFLNVLPQI